MNRLHTFLLIVLLQGFGLSLSAQTDSLCVGNTVGNYHVVGMAGSTFLWNTQGNGTVLSGQGNDSTQIQWTTVPGLYQLQVTETSSEGCAGDPVLLWIAILPNLSATENVSVCPAQLPYSWNGNSYSSAGNYTVTLSTAGGCDSVVTLNLSVLPNLSATENVSVCPAQLPYSWNGSSYTSAGTYTLTLSTVSGCDSVVTLNLSVLPQISVNQSVSICEGSSYTLANGVVVNVAGVYPVTLSSATGCDSVITTTISLIPTLQSNLSLRFCAGDQFTLPWGEVVSNPGVYTDTLPGAGGCDSVVVVTLDVDQPISLTLSPDSSICGGQSIALSVQGAENFFWSPAGSLSDSTTSTVMASPTQSTNYVVVGFTGACSDSDTVTVTVLPSPQAQITLSQNPVCGGDSVLVSVSGAESYLWVNSGLPCDTCESFWLPADSSITLQLLASTGPCQSSTSANLSVLPEVVASISGDTTLCQGETLTLIAGGGGTYVWSDGTANDTLQYMPGGSSFVSVNVSNGACSDTAQVAVLVRPLPVVDAGADTTIYFGGTANLQASANAEVLWQPTQFLSCIDCLDPLSNTPQSQTYCLTAVNTYGCMASDCVEITVDTLCAGLFVPNVFAPDESGHSENNCFRLYGASCVSTMTLSVFNRWGEKVYESRNPGDCWDGQFRGQALNTGVYVFYLEAQLITGESLSRQGNLTLIR